MFITDDPVAAADQRARFHAEQRAGLVEAGAWAGVALAERFRFLPTDR
jgi:hypothetical protein